MNEFLNFLNCIKNNRVKQGTWNDVENHKKYAIWLGETLGYKNMEDWYKITSDVINKNYGSGLIKWYKGSPSLFLKSVFSEYNWLEWKFTQTSQHFWKDIENHKKYAIWLGEILEYKNMDDWYKLTSDVISNNYGGGLIGSYYKMSPYLFLKSVFPHYNWLGWKFSVSPYNFWNFKTEKQYAIWLGETLGYKNMEDWYGISRKLIIDNFGGGYILAKYNGSPSLFIKSVFPEYNLLEWKFLVTNKYFWEDVENHKKYAMWLGEILGYKNMDDWYKITSEVISNNYGSTLVINRYNGSPSLFLKSVFPNYDWIKSKFKKSYSLGQIEWLEYIKVSTPDIRHVRNNKNGEFKIPNSNYLADGYSENKNCIYEYHGDFWHGNINIYNPKDINPCTKTSYDQLYNNTLNKQIFCEKEGFIYKYIWESEWIRGKNAVIILQKKYFGRFK
jgi:aromatic ring-cleaving dioxygenase